MSFSFKTTYELRQETPLIHFQHDQSGATLRATEVKPKLDKFLLRRYKHDNPGTKTPKNWFLKDTDALDYKLRFECKQIERIVLDTQKDESGKSIPNPYDIYYGNMGLEKGKKVKGVKAQNETTVACTIICLKKELLDYIKKHIEEFFIVTNFGRMQRKGFGSFLIDKDGEGEEVPKPSPKEIAQALCKEYGSKYCYSLPGDSAPFKRIKALYGIMKSGYNFGGTYHKSLLFEFMQKEGFPNEKRGVKVRGIAPKIYKPENIDKVYTPFQSKEFVDEQDETFYYVRALLGLADHLEFNGRGDYRIIIDGKPKEGYEPLHVTVDITPLDKNIERLKSPIFFKIIGHSIYYVGEPLNRDILGKEFTFSSSWDDAAGKVDKTVDKTGQAPPTFRVPAFAAPETVIDGFLEYVFNQRKDAFKGVSDLKGREGVVKFTRFNAGGQEVR